MRLSDATVTIVGLGLMGGSLALALRGKCRRLVGVARRPETVSLAIEAGVVDAAACDMRPAVQEADVVGLATPVRHIISAIPQVARDMRPGALLMDLGSTKVKVVEAMDRIPANVAAIGGHPMCGKEVDGLENADGSIFSGAKFALTPTTRTTPEALALAAELAQAAGASPLVIEAERHDRAAAMVSHLPYLLASSLVHAEAAACARDATTHALAASGFRDTSRLGASDVDMMLDILLTNRQEVEMAFDTFERTLAEARALLGDPARLRLWMAEARDRRRSMFQ
jgi:prephenate dehydrogenase